MFLRRAVYWISLGLGPDPVFEDLVQGYLRTRSVLPFEEWLQLFSDTVQARPDVAQFLYEGVGEYFGLEAGRIRPEDRIEEDLHLARIGWSDWDFDFRSDFRRRFGIDVLDRTHEQRYTNIEEWLAHLCRLIPGRHGERE